MNQRNRQQNKGKRRPSSGARTPYPGNTAAQELSPAGIRARAAMLVTEVVEQGRSLDALFAQLEGSAQERGLTRVLVYGTIRWYYRLDRVLAQLLSRPSSEIDPALHALLLIGLFQILHTDIAIHAAVAETVEATRKLGHSKAAGLVNAVLRRCEREKIALCQSVDSDIETRTSHPAWLVNHLHDDWPDRYQQILDANNEHPPMWLRVNIQRTTVPQYQQDLRAAGIDSETSDCAPQALLLANPTDVRNLPHFATGHVSVQDAAAQWAAILLGARKGDRVLDACAAPGGKTCHILELQPEVAELVAIDLSATRLRRVSANLERLGLQANLLAADAAEPESWWDGKHFDRILLDVPCSATGVIRRHPDIKLLRRESDIRDLAVKQAEILRKIWPLVTNGGRLVYASCSALRSENAELIAAFLRDHPDAHDVTMPELQRGLLPTCKLGESIGPGYAIAAGQSHMDGFYFACLDKVST